MTGRYVSTSTSIYTDPDLADWSTLTLFFYRYLYENDHAHGITGIGRISHAVMEVETRMTTEEIMAAKRRIGTKVRWYRDGTYWVVGRATHTCYKRDKGLNPKVVKNARLFILAQCNLLRRDFATKYGDISALTPDTLPIGDPPVPNLPNLPSVNVNVNVNGDVNENPISLSVDSLASHIRNNLQCKHKPPYITEQLKALVSKGVSLETIFEHLERWNSTNDEIWDILKPLQGAVTLAQFRKNDKYAGMTVEQMEEIDPSLRDSG